MDILTGNNEKPAKSTFFSGLPLDQLDFISVFSIYDTKRFNSLWDTTIFEKF